MFKFAACFQKTKQRTKFKHTTRLLVKINWNIQFSKLSKNEGKGEKSSFYHVVRWKGNSIHIQYYFRLTNRQIGCQCVFNLLQKMTLKNFWKVESKNKSKEMIFSKMLKFAESLFYKNVQKEMLNNWNNLFVIL